jgi:nucleotide-binding universal stress UspA family protein
LQSIVNNPGTVRQILLSIDGSDHAKRATQVAIGLASSYKAGIVIISVVSPPGLYISGPVGGPADLADYYQIGTEGAKSAIASAMALAKSAGVDARSKVIQPAASVVEGIVDYASSEKIDLIVVGTRGLGGFKKMLLGSVSSGVVANSPCSVLVVR